MTIIGGLVTTGAGTVILGTVGTVRGITMGGAVEGATWCTGDIVEGGAGGRVVGGAGGGVEGGAVDGGAVEGGAVEGGVVGGGGMGVAGVTCAGFVVLVPALPHAVRPTPSAIPSMTAAVGLRSVILVASPRWVLSDYEPAAPRRFMRRKVLACRRGPHQRCPPTRAGRAGLLCNGWILVFAADLRFKAVRSRHF
jgi:hypothetical protein